MEIKKLNDNVNIFNEYIDAENNANNNVKSITNKLNTAVNNYQPGCDKQDIMDNADLLTKAVTEYKYYHDINLIKKKEIEDMMTDIVREKYVGKVLINIEPNQKYPKYAYIIRSVDNIICGLQKNDKDLLFNCTSDELYFRSDANNKWYTGLHRNVKYFNFKVSINNCNLLKCAEVSFKELSELFNLPEKMLNY